MPAGLEHKPVRSGVKHKGCGKCEHYRAAYTANKLDWCAKVGVVLSGNDGWFTREIYKGGCGE